MKSRSDSLHLAALNACEVALEKHGKEVLLLDLHQLPAPADYFVIVTGRSQVHARALAQALEEALDRFPLSRRGIEGYPNAPWILLDYYGIVVHIFLEEDRDYYNLEKLWSSARAQKFREELGTVHVGTVPNELEMQRLLPQMAGVFRSLGK